MHGGAVRARELSQTATSSSIISPTLLAAAVARCYRVLTLPWGGGRDVHDALSGGGAKVLL